MSVLSEPLVTPQSARVLEHAFRFVQATWQHADRDESADQGFESQFRTSCSINGAGWGVSQNRELSLGLGLATSSGVLHEIDVVVRCPPSSVVIFELKNKIGSSVDKNDALVFFSKALDYVAANPELCRDELNLVFLTARLPDFHGLAACLGLGIHPIAPGFRPLSFMQNYALGMETLMSQNLPITESERERFLDFCADLNGCLIALRDVWPSARWGYHSHDAIFLRTPGRIEELETLPARLIALNVAFAECLHAFQAAKSTAS